MRKTTGQNYLRSKKKGELPFSCVLSNNSFSQSKRSSLTSRKTTPTPEIAIISETPESSSKDEEMSKLPEVIGQPVEVDLVEPEIVDPVESIKNSICKNEMGLNFMTHQEDDTTDEDTAIYSHNDVALLSKPEWTTIANRYSNL